MSEYMRMKVEMEAMLAKLETVRQRELDAEVIDIRKRVIAWGITPEQVFPSLRVSPSHKAARDSQRPVNQLQHPPVFAWQGHAWAGVGGPKPKWFVSALAAGVSKDDMIAECKRLRAAGKLRHPVWDAEDAQG